ncbi:hypothetical protein SAMN00120144_3115 [Hymenobacter roseosalivarius DSM 11622]|uniref:Uncharacterized protein n=1 Tax=Hymenobacter roseosalivarius DSM 11622 TaxID=645990 RepID=A0A1W1UE40_9BACT|nr:hypothetical protein SAMN00120144_3115 [Hymenobacter roseosalivarius DSM 11622]
MSSPQTAIRHTTREVQQALSNNCWGVYHRAVYAEGEPVPESSRVFQTRTQRGQFQVRYLQTGQWHNVAPADLLFQQ